MNLTDISIKRPSLILVLFSVLSLLGYIGYKNLNYELMPDFNQPVVVIKTGYPGASPKEVENALSRKIEDALSNLEGIDNLITKSLPNASVVIVNLKYGTDLDKTMQNAQRYIDNIKKDLPKDILNPVMSKVSPNDLPIISISASSKMEDIVFYQKMKDEFLPRIQQISGLAEITLLGGKEREIQININQDKQAFYKIPLLQVVESVNRSGIDVPLGKIESEKESSPIRYIGKFTSINELENVQVGTNPPGIPIYLKHIATVSDGVKEITSINKYNGKPGIGLLLKKQGDANAVHVSKEVRAVLKQIEKEYQESAVHFTIADDSTNNTIEAVDSVIFDLILAVILVSIVMLLFLRSFRNSIIVLIAIPTSLVTAFAVMWMLNYTLNLMTLLAMSLIIGILVDDATVVLENIQRHLDMGKEKRKASMEGRMEIGFSAISITLVDIVVFLPILFLQVFVADMLKQFSVVVITSTLTSLLVGFTLTPWLSSRIGKKEDLKPTNYFNIFLIWFEKQLETFSEWYGRKLSWVLHHKTIFIAFVLLLFVLTGVMMKQGVIGKELISTGDQGKFRLTIELDQSATLQQNHLVSEKIEKQLLQKSEIESVFSNIGGPSTGIGSLGLGDVFRSEFTIQLKPKAKTHIESTEQYMCELRKELRSLFPGINYSIATLGLIPKSAPIEFTLSGSNLEQVLETGKSLQAIIENIPGTDNVQLSVDEENTEYTVIPDKIKMQGFGFNSASVGLTLRTALTGNDDASFTENGIEYPIRIQLDKINRKNATDLNRLQLINPQGIPIQVNQFATVKRMNSPTQLERKDRQPAVTITSNTLGRPSGTVADDVVKYLDKNPLAEGIQMTWGSDIKRQQDSFGALSKVLLVSFLLIYLIMVALYDSFVYPFVVLFSIPVAIIGAFLALNLSMSNISLFALLGLIMLMGLVVKNAILIVDFTNQLKAEGNPYKEALILAGKGRMRPILMTTISMIIGMLPIALATGSAAEWKNGLAWVIIGGLLSSLILTVFLVPVVYDVVDNLKMKWIKHRN
jgi:hydrophobic/amphiphilic exporter-1 (mainly G- bacteria), HAE1 family